MTRIGYPIGGVPNASIEANPDGFVTNPPGITDDSGSGPRKSGPTNAEVRRGFTAAGRPIDIERVQRALDLKRPKRRAPHTACVYALARAVEPGTARIEMRTIARRAHAGLATAHSAIHDVLDLGCLQASESELRRGGWIEEEEKYEFRRDCLIYSGPLVWSEDPSLPVSEADRTLWAMVIEARQLGMPEDDLLSMLRRKGDPRRQLGAEIERAKARQRAARQAAVTERSEQVESGLVRIQNAALETNEPNTSVASSSNRNVSCVTTPSFSETYACARTCEEPSIPMSPPPTRPSPSPKASVQNQPSKADLRQLIATSAALVGELNPLAVLGMFWRAAEVGYSVLDLVSRYTRNCREIARYSKDPFWAESVKIDKPASLATWRVRMEMAADPVRYRGWRKLTGVSDDLAETYEAMLAGNVPYNHHNETGSAAAMWEQFARLWIPLDEMRRWGDLGSWTGDYSGWFLAVRASIPFTGEPAAEYPEAMRMLEMLEAPKPRKARRGSASPAGGNSPTEPESARSVSLGTPVTSSAPLADLPSRYCPEHAWHEAGEECPLRPMETIHHVV